MNQPSQNLYHGKEGPVLGTELITIGNEPPKEYSQPIAPASQIYSENTSSDNPPPVANSEILPQYPGVPIQNSRPFHPSMAQYSYQPYINQVQPYIIKQYITVPPLKLKTSPETILCPFCQNNITTIVKKECNCLDFCFCYFFCYLWCIIKLFRRKDLCCVNAIHKCPQCGQIIGYYNAC